MFVCAKSGLSAFELNRSGGCCSRWLLAQHRTPKGVPRSFGRRDL